MPLAQIASSHYEADGQGDGRKMCVNYYAEANPQDPARPMRLVTTPGSRALGLVGNLRGIGQADKHANDNLLVVDGSAVRTYNPSSGAVDALAGSVTGNDRVQMAFAENEAAILSGGVIHISTGTSIARVTDPDWDTLLADHGQTGFTSIDTIGQRLLASYGSRFAYSNTLDAGESTTISFYTAEDRPDRIVCIKVVGDRIYVFGTQTIEVWYQTGSNDDPLSPITSATAQRGCAARDSVVLLDNSLFFIADDRTVRRLADGNPIVLNRDDVWITRHLETVDPEDIVCSAIETDSHAFYIIRTPLLCIVYDVLTNTFHLRQSYLQGSWDYLFHQRIGAQNLAASATDLVELSRETVTDLDGPIVREFTAHLPIMSGRGQRALQSVRLDGTKGVGVATGQGTDPVMAMAISKDEGLTFGAYRNRKIGLVGKYTQRTIWRQNGRLGPEQTVLRFRCSDPVKHAITGVAVNED